MRVTVSAAEDSDNERLRKALMGIAGEDRSLRMVAKPEGAAYVLEGISESQLDGICDRISDEYRLAIRVGAPEVILVETIRGTAEAEGKYVRQTGGAGNYGHCWLRLEPNTEGEACEFVSKVTGDILPEEYVIAIERGVRSAMDEGITDDRPLVGVKVTLTDGSYHAQDSNPKAFEIAASVALTKAVRKASPVLLEPVMAVAIDVPEVMLIAIEHRIHELRGRIENIGAGNGWSEIRAIVPLAELMLAGSEELSEFPAEFVGYEEATDDGIAGEDGPGVTANRPDWPRRGRGSEAARAELEDS